MRNLLPPRGEAQALRLYLLTVALFDCSDIEHADFLASALQACAGAGVADAWADLGRCRWNGWGVPQDRPAGLRDYLRAARGGSAEGAYLAGYNLYWSFQDYDRAYDCLRQVLALGDFQGRAKYLLGLMAYHGRGCARNLELAVSFYQSAAAEGSADAMFELSVLHLNGIGLSPDDQAALQWCCQAAEQDQDRACYNMGAFYATGALGLPLDLPEAVRWYERAAELGNAQADLTLGRMFLTGEDGPPDPDLALLHLRRASQRGLPVLATLAEQLQLDQEATERLQEFLEA